MNMKGTYDLVLGRNIPLSKVIEKRNNEKLNNDPAFLARAIWNKEHYQREYDDSANNSMDQLLLVEDGPGVMK